MRVAEAVAKILADHSLRHVFMVTGGGAMHLNDALAREKRLQIVCCHHEQSCAMAADAYVRMSGRPAVVNVTTGPGGINALNGVFGAWTDSQAMIVISGQVKRETTVACAGPEGLRQLGDQEVDIVSVVKPLVKFAVMVRDPLKIREILEEAIYQATSGRPGPVWVDIPIDVQAAPVDFDSLSRFLSPQKITQSVDSELISQVIARLKQAKRPVILGGGGVRIAGARNELLTFAEQWKIPLVTGWNAHDLVPNDHVCYGGRPGTIGDRAGNFAVQNSDLLIIVGSRLNIRQVGYNWKSFARHAFKIWCDVDALELQKPTVKANLPVHCSADVFLKTLLQEKIDSKSQAGREQWLQWVQARVQRYPTVLPEYRKNVAVNPYVFVESLFDQLASDDRVVTADGTACVVTFQAARVQKNTRLFTNSGSASMGFDLPAAIGAWFSGDKQKRIVCLAGDGSIMMNLQELATIAHHKVPAKIFLLDNKGYHSIRQTQTNYFPDNIVGCGPESGLGFPDFAKIADAFGLQYQHISKTSELNEGIQKTLNTAGPVLCRVELDLSQGFSPKASSKKLADGRMVSSPLEDLAPFLSREELKENMLVPLVAEEL
jgi:acetolactate synthase-1/2/3 large subunit